MRKILILLLALAACAAFAADNVVDSRPVVRIGITAPLTGEFAQFGQTIVGWKKAVMQQIESTRTHLRYEIFVEDDQMQSRQAVLAARRLIELNNVNVLFSYSSPSGSAIAPIANERKVPHICVAYNPAAVVGNYNVSMVPPVETFLPPFFELLQKKNYHRIALFYVRNATWQPIFDKLIADTPAHGARITYQQVYNPGERDFRMGVQQIPADTDAVVILAWAPEVNIIVNRLAEQGVAKPLLSLGGSLVFSDRSKSMNGAIDIFLENMPDIDNINQAYTGLPTHTNYGANFSDQMTLTASIHERYWEDHQKIIPADEFMKQLKAVKNFPSVFGPASCLPSGYFSFTPCYYLIKNGKLAKLELNQL